MRIQRTNVRVAFAVLIVLLLVASFLELSLGPVNIPVRHVFVNLWAYLAGRRSEDAVVMGAIRLPELLEAGLVGAGLATTGAVLQAIFRNPMADPGIIGISSGSSVGAVLIIALGVANLNQWFTPAAAFVSGMVTVYVIYRLGTIGGRTLIHSLLLSGVAVSSLCSAVVTLILSLEPLQTMHQILFWLMGGLDGSTWLNVVMVTIFVVVGFVVYLTQSTALDILSVGEEQAEGVGVPLQAVKQLMLIVSALVVGACVSVSGVIGFIGLIVPHLMRIWIGPSHGRLLWASALGGATLLIASDVVSRIILLPIILNVGIVTACLGAPFFLYLLRRQFSGRMGAGV